MAGAESSCGADCTSEWLFGAAGSCVAGICECPEGYHGIDDFAAYPDCHVNIALQRTMYGICAALGFVLLLHTSYALIYLVQHWKLLPTPRLRVTTGGQGRTLSKSSTGVASRMVGSLSVNIGTVVESARGKGWGMAGVRGGSPDKAALAEEAKRRDSMAPSARSTEEEQEISAAAAGATGVGRARPRKGVRKRQQSTLLAIALFLFYSTGVLLYYMPMLVSNQYRHQGYWYVYVGSAKAVASVYTGLWLMSYMWYRSLPSVHLYGQLFDIHSLLLRWPNAVRYATVANIVVVNLFSAIFMFIVPLARPDLREVCDQILLVGFVIFTTIFVAYFFALCTIIKKVFTQLLALNSGRLTTPDATGDLGTPLPRAQPLNTPTRESRAFRRGIQVTNIMLVMTATLGPLAIFSAVGAAWVPFFRKRLHISVSLVSASAELVANICTFVLIRRLEPRRRPPLEHAVVRSPSALSTSGVMHKPL